MGIYDRPYWREESPGGGAGPGTMGGLTVGLPKPSRMVKYLLLINLGAFVLQLVVGAASRFGVVADLFGAKVGAWWQVWRYLTCQFLHSPDSLWHIGLNMLGLYMLGTPLERHWGARRFLTFYLSCGAVAALSYVAAGAILGSPDWIPIIGASGGVYGIVLAAAVLFPHFRLIMVFFPVPIRLAALIIFGGMGLFLLTSLKQGAYSGAFWSHVAHMGGAVMAAGWLWVIPRVRRSVEGVARKANQGAWERKLRRRRAEQADLDRILDKIHQHGINSLSRKEKKLLHEATHRQQQEENELTRL